MLQNTLIGVLAVLAVAFGVLYFVGQQPVQVPVGAQSGPDHYNAQYFQGGLTVGASGSAVDLVKCATASWNPDAVATSTLAQVTSKDIALSGAVMGDVCVASLSSATSTSALVNCDISGTATATIKLTNTGVTALDIATGTARVCVVSF